MAGDGVWPWRRPADACLHTGRWQRLVPCRRQLARSHRQEPRLHRELLKAAYAFQTQVTQTALANGRSKIEERLARWLLMADDRLDGEELPLTHEFPSLMLGVERSGVTLAVQALEADGLIAPRRVDQHPQPRQAGEEVQRHLYAAHALLQAAAALGIMLVQNRGPFRTLSCEGDDGGPRSAPRTPAFALLGLLRPCASGCGQRQPGQRVCRLLRAVPFRASGEPLFTLRPLAGPRGLNGSIPELVSMYRTRIEICWQVVTLRS